MTVNRMRRIIELGAALPEADLSKLSGDEQTVKQIRDAMVSSAKEKVLKSYVEGLKKGMKIKINKDVLSS